MTGEDFIALAGRLAVASNADEAMFRSAVSRSYYGAFHVVKRFFDTMELRVSHDHGELQRCLIESGRPQSSLAGRYLNDLHSSRVKADYDLANQEFARLGHARECVELATDICALLTRLDAAEQAQVKRGIEAYRERLAIGRPKNQ